jgi:hypothetical protein
MNSTEATSAPAVDARQVGQVLAGRYHLGMFKGGDDVADVWHALDDSTEKVVTLEILRDRTNDAARQRFLAEARRMAAIERPSVMRVASIHDGATDTFIVFEHLIPLPVVLTELSAIARDVKPATKAEDDKTVVLGAMAGPTRPPVAAEPASLQAAINAIDAVDATAELDATTIVAPAQLQVPAAPPTTVGQVVSGALTTARSDVSAAVAEVRALLPQNIDTSPVTALIARVSTRVHQLTDGISLARASLSRGAARASSIRVAAPARAAVVKREGPQAGGAVQAVTSIGSRVASSAAPLMARAASSAAPLLGRAGSSAGPLVVRAASNVGPLIARVVSGTGSLFGRVPRVHPVILAVPIGLLLLGVFVMSPLDDAIIDVLRTASEPSATGVASTALAPAPFTVPPLSAYGATFESQGPYPTTTPNGTVEWVVALRNTGSAGWYRGIDGAQAALALPNGAGAAVQTTEYVAPGQVGWFIVKFRARAEPGTYTVQLLPRIDGRGPLQDLGIFTVVTVVKNP